VFERNSQVYAFKYKEDGETYSICLQSDNIMIGVLEVEHFGDDFDEWFGEYKDVSKQIHASHFVLGNVTITF
jgi:hypothetical protein